MPTPAKKVPVRMCTGCREHKPKKELIRVVRSPEGEISIDFTGKKIRTGRLSVRKRTVPCKSA